MMVSMVDPSVQIIPYILAMNPSGELLRWTTMQVRLTIEYSWTIKKKGVDRVHV